MNINVKFRPSDLIKRRGWSRDRHGVKLAICLGLFSTAVGKPVVVRQNMRICEDCHRFAKKISRACNREIAKSSTISMVAFVLAGITGKEFMKVSLKSPIALFFLSQIGDPDAKSLLSFVYTPGTGKCSSWLLLLKRRRFFIGVTELLFRSTRGVRVQLMQHNQAARLSPHRC